MNGSLRKWVILGVLVLLAIPLVLIGQRMLTGSTAKAAAQTGQVTRGDIQSQVLSSAALQPEAELTLTFGSAGTLTALKVKPGDHVEKGQVLASLDTSDLNLAVVQAQASLSSAQAKLESVKAGAAAKDLANAESSLKSAQAKLDSLKAGATASDLSSSQASLKSAQAKLASVMAGSTALDISNAQATLKSAQAKLDSLKAGATVGDLAAADASLKSAQAKLTALKEGPTTAQLSAARLKVLQAQTSLEKTKSSSSLSRQQAEIALDQADHALQNAQDKYNSVAGPLLNEDGTLKDGLTQAQIDNYNTTLRALQDAEDNFRKANLSLNDAREQEILSVTTSQAQLDDAQKQLDDLTAPPTAADLTAAQASVIQAQNSLDKLKAPPTAADLASAQATVDQAQNNLDKLKAGPTDADIKAAQASVAQSQASFDKLKAPPATADLVAAQASVDQAQNNLGALKAGPAATDLATAQASVDQAQANLASAQAKLSNANLTAPFAGVVASAPVTLGQAVSANTTVVDLVDNSAFRLDMNVGEADVTRVQVGQPVEITFDALAGAVYTGTITFVSPKADVQQGVVTYLASVTIDPKAAGSNLRPGMSASAAAIVEQRTNVLIVPNRAVRTESRQKVVYVIGPNGSQVRVPIQAGISNDTSTEIVGDTPLREGDAVVINTTTTTTGGQGGGGLVNLGGGGFVRRGP